MRYVWPTCAVTWKRAASAIRMAKIHSKVSGCFQSLEGAKALAAVRSHLAIAASHSVGALDVLAQLCRGEAWIEYRERPERRRLPRHAATDVTERATPDRVAPALRQKARTRHSTGMTVRTYDHKEF